MMYIGAARPLRQDENLAMVCTLEIEGLIIPRGGEEVILIMLIGQEVLDQAADVKLQPAHVSRS
jgi:hypothetical protein